MNRAYSLLHVKTVDAEQRILRGMATTPTPDRMGDIVEPLGVKFKNPMPLLWQHNHDQPVGEVRFEKPTEDGIAFVARIQKSADVQSETLRNRLDEAWESVKLGLVKAVSIGFKPIEYSFLKESDGIHFLESEVMELSLVTIPANAEATISQIKSMDRALLAATGEQATARPKKPSGVTEQRKPKTSEHKKMPKTIAERISAFEATRAAKAARMEELMTKSDDEGATLDEADSQEYDGLEAEIKDIDGHLRRLNTLAQSIKAQAVVVDAAAEAANAARIAAAGGVPMNGGTRIIIKKPDLPKGTPFIRLCMTQMYAKGDTMKAIKYAQQWKDQTPEVAYVAEHDIPMLMQADIGGMMNKAAIGAGTTTDSVWAGPLVVYQIMASEFAELLRPATILGRIPGLRRVPFNIQLPATTSGTTVGWVGEGAPKPVSQMAFQTITMRWAKAAGIVVLTDELVRFSNPAAEAVVRNDLTKQMVQFLDRQFVDPSVAAVPNVSPASITNGVTAITASGTDAISFRNDIASLLNSFLGNNLSLDSGFFIMTQQQATKISMMNNTFSMPVYPTVSRTGGELLGFPVIASENLPATGGSPADGFPIIFGLADEIMLADDGTTMIDASNQASLQLDSAPDSPPSGTTNYISLWQNNMTGLRAERWINWQKRRTTCVGYIQNAKYA